MLNLNHRKVFFEAAEQFKCWIGVREPNFLSLRWIGMHGYTPKAETCKAKTADYEWHPFAGLVVDPIKCPEAFDLITRPRAVEKWQKFVVDGRLPTGYTLIESGHQAGLVKHNGMFIHADFDLMTIVRSNAQGEPLKTSDKEEEQLFAAVEPVLNKGLGTKLIQHGPEFMWDKVGAAEFEWVLWFGPGRRFLRNLSSMPKGGH